MICEVSWCESPVRSLGLCSSHYHQTRRGGLTSCVYEGCDETAINGRHSRCPLHYGRCAVRGCTREPYRGWPACGMHTQRLAKTGGYGSAESTRRAKGTGTDWELTKDGYLARRVVRQGVVSRLFQHRVIMEEHIGRPLRPEETVHHKNGNRIDNRLSNLELWSSSHPSGQRVEDKVAWAREILELYREMPQVQG